MIRNINVLPLPSSLSVFHRFWRIRLNPVGDQVIFETSPNGVTNWNDRHTVVRQVVLTGARIELSGGTSHTSLDANQVSFRQLRAEL